MKKLLLLALVLAACGERERSRAAIAQIDEIGGGITRTRKLSYSAEGRLEHVETAIGEVGVILDVSYQDDRISRLVQRDGLFEMNFDYHDGRLTSRRQVDALGTRSCIFDYNGDGLLALSRCAIADGTYSSTETYSYEDGIAARIDLEITQGDAVYREGTQLTFDGEQLSSMRRRVSLFGEDEPSEPSTYNYDYVYEDDRLISVSGQELSYDEDDRISAVTNTQTKSRIVLTYADVELQGGVFAPPVELSDFFDLEGRSFASPLPEAITF